MQKLPSFFSRLISLFFVLTPFFAFGQIEFFQGTWEEAIKTAQKKNKIIFVDAYTEWCGPCKMMSAQTFSDKAVGDFFNQHFVNVKLDMEKGEGTAFARNYAVNAYPTLLFISGKTQTVVHKVLGFRKAAEFLQEGTNVFVKEGGQLDATPPKKPKKPKKEKKPKKVKTTTEGKA
jgi:thioredoxin-related protein